MRHSLTGLVFSLMLSLPVFAQSTEGPVWCVGRAQDSAGAVVWYSSGILTAGVADPRTDTAWVEQLRGVAGPAAWGECHGSPTVQDAELMRDFYRDEAGSAVWRTIRFVPGVPVSAQSNAEREAEVAAAAARRRAEVEAATQSGRAVVEAREADYRRRVAEYEEGARRAASANAQYQADRERHARAVEAAEAARREYETQLRRR